MFSPDFLIHLEYEISKALERFDSEETRGFWCDGVYASEPEQYYSQKYVNDNGKILLTAFIGKDGQTKYELSLYFGPKALSRFARGLDITPCIPPMEDNSKFILDIVHRKLKIHLH